MPAASVATSAAAATASESVRPESSRQPGSLARANAAAESLPGPMPAASPVGVAGTQNDTQTDSDTLFPPRPAEAEGPPLAERASAFAGEHWPWFAGIVVLPLLFGLGAWLVHRRHYDASGLPRGPRL